MLSKDEGAVALRRVADAYGTAAAEGVAAKKASAERLEG